MKDQPAFPILSNYRDDNGFYHEKLNPGMTMRQWYAGMALQGIFSNSAIITTAAAIEKDEKKGVRGLCAMAFSIADQMLAHESPEKGK